MKLLVAAVLAAAVMLLIPAAAGAGEDLRLAALRVIQVPAVPLPAGFREFTAELESMLTRWWDHGGQGAARGTWQVIVAAITPPGETAHVLFVVSVGEERGKAWHLVLTFTVPARVAVAESFLAAHAAYDATMGAILGQYRGNRLWLGPGGGETARSTAPHGTDLTSGAFSY